MRSWKSESFHDLINQGHFGITDSGPLYTPIKSFSIRRNEHLRLILETHCPEDAKSTAVEYPSGTIRFNTDAIELTNIAGIKARAVGVQPLNAMTTHNYQLDTHGLKETSQIDYIEATICDDLEPRYTIEWLDNVRGHFVWPDSYKDESGTTETRTVGKGEGRGTAYPNRCGRPELLYPQLCTVRRRRNRTLLLCVMGSTFRNLEASGLHYLCRNTRRRYQTKNSDDPIVYPRHVSHLPWLYDFQRRLVRRVLQIHQRI
jgi:hypothetical protein